MHKTPDEIKKGLFVCSDFEGNCPYCPYAVNGHRDPEDMCVKQLANDADRLIRQLEPQRDGLLRRVKLLQDAVDQWELVAASPGAVEDMARENTELLEKVEQLQAERDAAVKEIKEAHDAYCGCVTCKNYRVNADCQEPPDTFCPNCPHDNCPCKGCSSKLENWQWRGVQKEE